MPWDVAGGFPLDRAADAHREVATGHGRGKVVLLTAAPGASSTRSGL
jgi:hypothetical protein